MREFKFRAWDRVQNVVVPVVEMNWLEEYWVRCNYYKGLKKPLLLGERNSFENEDTDGHIIMQYTGLKDYEGNEIYEGDIVKVNDTFGMDNKYHEVRYMIESDYPAFDLVGVEYDLESNALQYYHCVGIVEVVGNIYENPELLEEDN